MLKTCRKREVQEPTKLKDLIKFHEAPAVRQLICKQVWRLCTKRSGFFLGQMREERGRAEEGEGSGHAAEKEAG